MAAGSSTEALATLPTGRENSNMKAAVLGHAGIEVRDLEKPVPKANEVLIRVRASTLNRADLIVASGHQHGRVGGVGARIGLECAGDVEAIGSQVTGLKAGDRVMATAPGGIAEYAVTDFARVHLIPANNMTYRQAACFPVALGTMHNAIVTAGRLQRGETLLMQGASAGVGLIGMQIAKLMGASLVIGTSTNPQRRARLKEFGCDLAIDSSAPGWPHEVKQATGDKGVDVIIDLVSAMVANQNLAAAAILGRIVNVGRLGGMMGEFDFDLHATKRIDYIGVTFRTRTIEEIRDINRLMRADLWPALEAGELRLPISKAFALSRVAEALEVMKANQHFGKIAIDMEPGWSDPPAARE
jgi:NADPH:quinone reductase